MAILGCLSDSLSLELRLNLVKVPPLGKFYWKAIEPNPVLSDNRALQILEV